MLCYRTYRSDGSLDAATSNAAERLFLVLAGYCCRWRHRCGLRMGDYVQPGGAGENRKDVAQGTG